VQLKFITNPIILEFVLGLLIALIYKMEISKKRKLFIGYFLFFLAILIFMSLIFYKNDIISEQTNILKGIGSSERFLFWGIPSGILVLGLVLIEKSDIENFPKVPFFINLGEASYSIYLTHQLCLFVYLSTNKRIYAINSMNADFKILVLTIILLFFGYIFHKYFETPFLKYANKITK
jgi:peptidoglycan/LPS O-acetylase OafA/YrhL